MQNKFELSEERIITNEKMPAGRNTCNARRLSRDSYCKSPGVAPFARCRKHGGMVDKTALDIFKQSVTFEQAKQLDILIQDTLSMDNELGAAKQMLVHEIANYHRANHYLKEFTENVPSRPLPDDPDFEKEMASFNSAYHLHLEIMEKAESLRKSAYKNAQGLIRLISEGVAKNNKIKEGSKFQLDVKQISRLLKVIYEAHAICKGCVNLKKVLEHIKEHTRDIPLNPQHSKANKEAIGRRAMQDIMSEVNERIPDIEETEFEVEDEE